jgi:hypothetical protein
MSELFTRVMDPRQARLCDFLVLPPTKRLNLSPKTLSSLGLPNGFTCRSPNSTSIVKTLFSGEGTQMFFLSSILYTTISETDRLLNPSVEELIPEVRRGTLFPFGKISKGLEFSAWMRAYADLKNGIPYPTVIEHSFLRVGYDRSMALADSITGELTDDRIASDICDKFRLFGTPGADATERIPHSNGVNPTQMCLKSLDLHPYGASSYNMQFVRGSFLSELVKRGALLIRPSDALLEAVTNRHLHWYADCVRKAFGERISTVDLAMDRLRNARKADKTREAKWARVKKLTARLSSKRMEAFTQALEGMATEAQKGKKR